THLPGEHDFQPVVSSRPDAVGLQSQRQSLRVRATPQSATHPNADSVGSGRPAPGLSAPKLVHAPLRVLWRLSTSGSAGRQIQRASRRSRGGGYQTKSETHNLPVLLSRSNCMFELI